MMGIDLRKVFIEAKDNLNLQNVLNDCLKNLDYANHYVIVKEFQYKNGFSPAFSIGLNIDILKFPFGWILISDKLLKELSFKEQIFVIFHELGHILKNHLVGSTLTFLVKESVIEWFSNELGLSEEGARNLVGAIKLFVFKMWTIEEVITRKGELEADRFAIICQGQKRPAISVLLKMSRGMIETPSHFSKDGIFRFPVISFQERICAIKSFPLKYMKS